MIDLMIIPRPDAATTIAMLNEAIELHAGSEARLARAAGFSQNALWHARRVGRVSADLALGIGRATGHVVSIARLRPDIVNATSIPSPGDNSSRAAAASPNPNSEIEESPTPVRGVGGPVATPAPADG